MEKFVSTDDPMHYKFLRRYDQLKKNLEILLGKDNLNIKIIIKMLLCIIP